MNKNIVDLEAFRLDYMFDVDEYTNMYTHPHNAKNTIVDFYEEFELWKKMYHNLPNLIGGYELSFFRYIVEYVWVTVKNKDRVEIESIFSATDVYLTEIMSVDTTDIDSEIFYMYNMDELNVLLESILNKKYALIKNNKESMLKHWIINNKVILLVLTGD